MSLWHVYMLRCADGTLYTGITTDIDRRLEEHNGLRNGGAKYTRCRRPVSLVWSETGRDRSQVSRREYEIKRLTKRAKLALIGRTEADEMA